MTAAAPARLEIEGELTILTAAEYHEGLLRLLTGGQDLEVGLAGVTEFDTAGLQVLMLARQEARRRGVPLRLTGHSAAVLEVLALAWLTPDLGAAA
ncbi:STAS domain-containing protein [Dactylosporangium sp. NPDC000555]|uniref:STAS domain-containing protein n=1 Tax=Dactylosporangium sp. NPDC000555 TaxID=3154260 RepID=UPI003332D266